MSSNGLTPTPIVNKNGVQTTVYRKNQNASVGIRPFPSPTSSFSSSRPQRHLVIDQIWAVMEEGINRSKISAYMDRMTDVFRNLSGAKDDSYPEMVLEMVTAIIPRASALGVSTVLKALSKDDEVAVRGLHAHRDYFTQNPQYISGFVPMKDVLVNVLGITPEDDGSFPSLESHINAKQQYERITTDPGYDGETTRYFNAPNVMRKVQDDPEHVSELMEYIARGQDDPDFEGFDAYLNGGVMRDGTL